MENQTAVPGDVGRSPTELMDNPYTPPENEMRLDAESAGVTVERVHDSTPRRFRYRVIPASLCLLLGVPLVCMSAFWCYEIWHTTISSDHDVAFRSVPPVLFCGMALGGSSFILASRRWLRGYWRSAVAATIVGWASVYVAFRIAVLLVPEAA
jgi:hypothetical protein